MVVRLDGTVEEVTTGLPPNNPNFCPRQAWPGGKIVTNDKLEVQLRFYERKGLPLTEELKAKKDELEAVKKASQRGVWDRLGGKAIVTDVRHNVQGRVIKLGGVEGAMRTAASKATRAAPRPKGGVRVLTGAEGALRGEKRQRFEADGVL
eukprot:CAMPEP_0181194398 /NCGR_PEP_ID=MMETSP1096-20121128/14318_1 /TAXON_ID=156174 ORGANISM="Chrysochromulina ericina, Strain CCMP281" /NCGR_SAMPLE_ID=MMETSP1096 /ASSEMBLY_ACC=CAM_ASM_000453 /LENGTH=149 /DNA_ID=CAMNT_0023283903 /DNA_START=182 /DNA_END=631 /DNA_ORIENTATION=+